MEKIKKILSLAPMALVGVTSSGALEASDVSSLITTVTSNGGTFMTNAFWIAGVGVVMFFILLAVGKLFGVLKLGGGKKRRR